MSFLLENHFITFYVASLSFSIIFLLFFDFFAIFIFLNCLTSEPSRKARYSAVPEAYFQAVTATTCMIF